MQVSCRVAAKEDCYNPGKSFRAATMLRFVPLTFKNLLRNRRRTILTVASITMSLLLVGVLLSVYSAFYFRAGPEEEALRLIVRHRVSLAMELPQYYESRIRDVDGLETMTKFSWFGGKYKDNRPEEFFARFAVDPEQIFKVLTEVSIPEDQYQAWLRDRQGIAIGTSVVNRTGLKLGDRFTLVGDIYPIDLDVVVRAIFEGPEDNNSFFHWKYFEESLPENRRGEVGTFYIRVRSADDVPRVAQAIDDMFRNSPQPTKTETERAFQLSFVSQMGNVKLFLLSIAGAVVFTILLVSGNTVAMSVRERIQEIGVLKTLGFTSATVLSMIIAEAVLIAFVGGVLGTALTYMVTGLATEMLVGFFEGLIMPWWGVFFCLGVALLIGLFSSIVPAIIAARTRVTDALRHAG